MVVVITSTWTMKNTCQAIICDKIVRFLQIQAHFQAVYPDKQQLIRKKKTINGTITTKLFHQTRRKLGRFSPEFCRGFCFHRHDLQLSTEMQN